MRDGRLKDRALTMARYAVKAEALALALTPIAEHPETHMLARVQERCTVTGLLLVRSCGITVAWPSDCKVSQPTEGN